MLRWLFPGRGLRALWLRDWRRNKAHRWLSRALDLELLQPAALWTLQSPLLAAAHILLGLTAAFSGRDRVECAYAMPPGTANVKTAFLAFSTDTTALSVKGRGQVNTC